MSKIDTIIKILPESIRPIVRDYAFTLITMSKEDISRWIDWAVDSPDAALLYLDALEQTPKEKIIALQVIANRVAELNLKHTQRRNEAKAVIAAIFQAGILALLQGLTDTK
ncbi:MAG TPA: hypothetical protein HPP87_04620 [Planctomycetes bacterium]|nr:hypothetical protein [Planctomycetota bacterium]HIJ70631.1 hypothetical protein [Planctomycetota bacterium]